MVEFLAAFEALAQTTSVWIYIIIFFGKMTEVAVATLRIVLINRGIRVLGSLIAVIEIVLWLIITSTVLGGFRNDPFKILVYAAAYGLGNFLGSWLDEKLAFGLSNVQVVVKDVGEAHTLVNAMRAQGYGVTTMDVHGIDDENRYMLVAMIKRKSLQNALKLINQTIGNAVITVTDVKVQKGGYLRSSATRPPISAKEIIGAQAKTPAEAQKDDQGQTPPETKA